jgi:DNA-binding protein Fis
MASAPAEAGEPPAPRDLDALLADLLDRKIALSDVEDRLLKAAVERSNGNISRAAGLLGLTRPQLDYRVRKRLASKS